MAERKKFKGKGKNAAYTQDFFQKKARELGTQARSYFKLEQIDKQLQFIKSGKKYLDLGACPGSWSDYIIRKTKNQVSLTLVDLLPLKKTTFSKGFPQRAIVGDVRDISAREVLPEDGSLYDGVLSDMAPSTTGQKDADSYASYELVLAALRLADEVLKEGGFFLAKYLEGSEMGELKKIFKQKLGSVRIMKPMATRKFSRELFLFAIKSNFSS